MTATITLLKLLLHEIIKMVTTISLLKLLIHRIKINPVITLKQPVIIPRNYTKLMNLYPMLLFHILTFLM